MADSDYLSRFSGEVVDQRLAAVATIQAALESLTAAVAAKYSKPAGGIPETDLDADVRAALALARSAVQSLSGYYTSAQVDGIVQALELAIAAKYSIPSGGIPASDLASAVQTSLGKADSAYQKPVSGIPASDLAAGVIPDVSEFVTKSVNDLVNYYLKSETYTKAEVQQLIAAIQGLSVEVVASLPTASADTMRKIYLVPSADPQTQNVKDEYITIDNGSGANPRYTWEQIGSTAIDLSGYVTTQQLNTALAAYTTTANLTTLLAAKQDTISDLNAIRSGAAAGATAYQKPPTGIPANDLASGVIPDDYVSTSDIEEVQDVEATLAAVVLRKTAQVLTAAEKAQVLENLGLDDPQSGGTPQASVIPANGLAANVYYELGQLSADLTVTLDSTTEESGKLNIYTLAFSMGATARNVTLPSVLWPGGTAPTFEANMSYEIQFVNGRGTFLSFE